MAHNFISHSARGIDNGVSFSEVCAGCGMVRSGHRIYGNSQSQISYSDSPILDRLRLTPSTPGVDDAVRTYVAERCGSDAHPMTAPVLGA